MFQRFSSQLSLSARLKLLTLLWAGSALFSVVFTLLLSWRLEQAGDALNDVGKLRQLTYRTAYMVSRQAPETQIQNQVAELGNIMSHIAESDAVHPLIPTGTPPINGLIQTMLVRDWQNSIRPHFARNALPAEVDLYRFGGHIDLYVRALEYANEQNTQWLRRFQTALIMMIFVAAAFMIALHYAWIIHPLEALRDGVRRIGRGEFGTVIDTNHIREFSQVSKGFNRMSASLQTLYTDLEGQVARQTQDLARQNRDLALLYQTTRELHQSRKPQTAAEEFLMRVIPAVAAIAGSIQLKQEGKPAETAASIGLPPPEHAQAAEFPVCYQEEVLGKLTLYFSDGLPDARTHELLTALSSQLAVSVANSRLEDERRLLAVLQERNLIAQGLHDSIAQTLTFLNLQVQMLESAHAAGQTEQVEENLRFIKEGVQECYDDVRDLLLNFRTKISHQDFPEAVRNLLDRFRQQTHTEVRTTWVNEGADLSREEQLQVIFILQESLSNIRKHAQAKLVEVSLINRRDFTLSIRDNGIGFDTGRLKENEGSHIGLGIMQERARRIGAKLSVQSQAGQGTEITLHIAKPQRTAL